MVFAYLVHKNIALPIFFGNNENFSDFGNWRDAQYQKFQKDVSLCKSAGIETPHN